MLLDDQIPNLPKEDDDELELDHMDNETLRRLNVYRDQPTEPPLIKKFAAIAKSDYQAPANDKWRHDKSDLGSETEKMKLYEPKRSKWWFKAEDKKKKKKRTPTHTTPKASTPKATPKRTLKKRSTLHLVDEPDEVQPGNVNVEGEVGSSQQNITLEELENIIADQDATKVTKNAEKAGGETVTENVETDKETFEEGVVRTDSSETESDIDLTKIAQKTGFNGKNR
ncbi:hypothetical protein HanRHA438_Chr03g0114941 [Helianthus annuus]|uniref:Uncharacterized protein n=1 Tax=Helianthus annuus TaxID=4232 RepID=A0A9K3JEB4_HELAN|nr:hypothetical protein HanXRQr2_Chr03g0104011 [Helianthus annuus]KAJ0592575.1 hypothetical protein HanHA300_Chr03g0086691 [Helianthus annuus]KAJ0600167.1 hypothetical protein HanIR_Chr03g0113471 [Helianthus annuus]KAJ0607571.1 hypothetical protein HanHA89_Chr03g0098271 [Helianthus annuus]KAJ0767632.1 hypothetical protein HanLR1_Chr03g0091601 [Helianthus annuus]